jgi:hypothetical protein
MGARIERAKRALYVTRVARRSGLFRVLREIGVVGERAPTAEGARKLSTSARGARHHVHQARPAAVVAPRSLAGLALVGKTLSQADSVAGVLDPELDPVALLEEDSLAVMLEEAERRLEPRTFLSDVYTQLDALARLPRRAAQVVVRLESGTLKVGIIPTDLTGLGASFARPPTVWAPR